MGDEKPRAVRPDHIEPDPRTDGVGDEPTARPPDAQPPKPPDKHCVVCGETLEWEWDDDGPVPSDPPGYVPQPHWTPSSLIWGKAPHCSRRCYLKGDEYRQKQEAMTNVDA